MGDITAEAVMLSESSLTLRGFRRRTPPMRPAHLKDGRNDSLEELNEGVVKATLARPD